MPMNLVGNVVRNMEELSVLVTAAGLVLALLQCFFGFRFIKFWISSAGFCLGAALGFVLSRLFLSGMPFYSYLLIGAATGLVFGFLAYRIYLAGLFLYCGCIAYVASMRIPYPAGREWMVVGIAVGLICFFAAGYLAVRFSRPCIIVLTAVTGAVSIGTRARMLFPDLAADSASFWTVVALCALLGMAVQFLTTGGLGRKK